MTHVSVEAWSHGDGYLTVDTQEWINDRGEYAADLTEDLREWMNAGDHRWPTDEVLTEWITDRTGTPPAGLHGDGEMWQHNLFNFADHLIDDFGFVVLSAAQLGDLMITVSGEGGRYEAPTVYRSTVDDITDWADYSNAEGECVNGHRWSTNDTVHLHPWDSADVDTYRVLPLIRVPFGDRTRAYVACPSCGKSVRFCCRF